MRVPWTAGRSNQSNLKEISPEYWKDWCWRWSSNTLATWCKELTHWERPWCWEILKVGGEWDDGGWDGWMASPTRWTWVLINSRSWWRTGKPGVHSPWWHKGFSMTEQLKGTELNWLLWKRKVIKNENSVSKNYNTWTIEY